MHSAGLELTKLTYYTRLEYNLIRHRGDRLNYSSMNPKKLVYISDLIYSKQPPSLLSSSTLRKEYFTLTGFLDKPRS